MSNQHKPPLEQTQFNADFINHIDQYIVDWDVLHPIDLWWRRKFNIAFGSIEHKKTNFIEQLICYREEKILEQLADDNKYTTEDDIFDAPPEGSIIERDTTGRAIKVVAPNSQYVHLSQSELEREFETLQLKDYNIST